MNIFGLVIGFIHFPSQEYFVTLKIYFAFLGHRQEFEFLTISEVLFRHYFKCFQCIE